jgi:hypothetical protein
MPTKSYLITGRNLSVDNLDTATVMTVTLSNPRPLHTVTVSQCFLTLNVEEDTAQQYVLRSNALTDRSTSEHRELTVSNEEKTGNALGHLRLIHRDAQVGHFELPQPVLLDFGNTPHRFPEIDFFVTNNVDDAVVLPINITNQIIRYDFSGAWTLDPDNEALAVTFEQTWGPNALDVVGGNFDWDGETHYFNWTWSTGAFVIKFENSETKKVTCSFNNEGLLTFVSENWPGGNIFDWEVDSAVAWYVPWQMESFNLPYTEENLEGYPFCQLKLTCAAEH